MEQDIQTLKDGVSKQSKKPVQKSLRLEHKYMLEKLKEALCHKCTVKGKEVAEGGFGKETGSWLMLSHVSVNTLALADFARVFVQKNAMISLYVKIITLLDWLRVEYMGPKVEAQRLIKRLWNKA